MDKAYVEVDELTFEKEVLERSRDVPVVVDFWADWCAPCRALGPVLERLAGEADGSWILAKVDVDANPSLAAAFRVQGIPAVRAFKNGRQVGEFTGALPESQVRTWLEKLGPTPADLALTRARAAEESGDSEAAIAAYREALDEQPANLEARGGLARLELEQRADSVNEAELRKRLDIDPSHVEVARKMADLSAARGNFDEAFDILLRAIRSTEGDDREEARLHLLALLDVLRPDDPRAIAARKSLYLALY